MGMVNLEDMKPDRRNALEVISQNREYLSGQEILGGENSFVKSLEGFYDLGWVERTEWAGRVYWTSNALEPGEECGGKHGTGPEDILGILEGVQGENDLAGDPRLDYERVREHFDKPVFPRWKKAINMGLCFFGLFGGGGMASHSFAVYSGTLGNPEDLVWRVPLTISMIALGFYMPSKNDKDKKKFMKENTSQESIESGALFSEVYDFAKSADKDVGVYEDLFGGGK